MNPAQIHLMLNHVPVLGLIFATMMVAAALWRRSDELLRAGLMGVVLAALLALPVFFSGEPAEETLEKQPGVTKNAIESHEDFARLAFLGLEVLGAVAALGLVRYRRRPMPAAFGALTLGLMVIGSMALTWTAHLGGRIRHSELRSTTAAVEPAQPSTEDD
jgi:uncharacterized membrane protein